MITVGINENVVLKSASITDKGYLKLDFRSAGDANQPAVDDPFAAASAGEAIDMPSGSSLNILKLLVPKETTNAGKTLTRDERKMMSSNDYQEMMNKIKHIMGCYLTGAQISEFFVNLFNGTGFSAETYKAQGPDSFAELLMDQDKLDMLSKNMFTFLIEGLRPFFDNSAFPMRLKLVRQSKEKHYGTLPKAKYVNNEPFMEPMSIPSASSKVKFSAYEIKNGSNDGSPVAQSSADATTAAPPMGGDADPFGVRS